MSPRQVWQAFMKARDHWARCEQCRSAAYETSSQWCEAGLKLMNQGVADDSHWDTCAQCREAQTRVQSAQCARGRELDDQYRMLTKRLAALQRD